MQHSDSFRAMDTQIDVVVEADGLPLDAFVNAKLLFARQEERLSRFRESSLVSALNRGETVRDPALAAICRLAIEAHRATGGLFNPMVLLALREAGYATTFAQAGGGEPRAQPVPDPARSIVLDGESVRLREGALDLGGIGKGHTVDLAVELLAERYANVLVNAGGDVRALGGEDGRPGWTAAVDHPLDGGAAWEGLLDGAMATSSTLRRRWKTRSGAEAHHLVDPRTGLPAESPFVQVTTWAASAAWAEVWAKALLIGGEPALERYTHDGGRALAFDATGNARFVPAG